MREKAVETQREGERMNDNLRRRWVCLPLAPMQVGTEREVDRRWAT